MPDTVPAKVIGGQLVRAGTSVGANYRAACRGRSKAEFIARLGVVEEEADESEFWLEMIVESGLMKAVLVEPLTVLVEPLISEADQLVAIMTSSRITSGKNQQQAKRIKNQNSKIKN